MKPPVSPMMLTLSKLIDEDKCYETVRIMRWPEGVCCIECGSKSITKRGKRETYPARQRYVSIGLRDLWP
ncbi:MAG: transposase, partial [Cyanobacteria bacterium J06554_1]